MALAGMLGACAGQPLSDDACVGSDCNDSEATASIHREQVLACQDAYERVTAGPVVPAWGEKADDYRDCVRQANDEAVLEIERQLSSVASSRTGQASDLIDDYRSHRNTATCDIFSAANLPTSEYDRSVSRSKCEAFAERFLAALMDAHAELGGDKVAIADRRDLFAHCYDDATAQNALDEAIAIELCLFYELDGRVDRLAEAYSVGGDVPREEATSFVSTWFDEVLVSTDDLCEVLGDASGAPTVALSNTAQVRCGADANAELAHQMNRYSDWLDHL